MIPAIRTLMATGSPTGTRSPSTSPTPLTWDTDGDGISDGEELFALLTDPLLWDTDGNGVGDGQELPA